MSKVSNQISFIVVGLGNKGEEYEKSRHNTGFIFIDTFVGKDAQWDESKNGNLLYTHEVVGKNKVEYIKPMTMMNRSGAAAAYAKKKHPKAWFIVVHDDLDIAFGDFKISFAKGAGGHNGVRSIEKSLKTKDFIRIRIGVTPATPTGKLRKPKGEEKVIKFLMGDFKKDELTKLKRVSKKIGEALEVILDSKKTVKSSKGAVPEGLAQAMNEFN